MSNETLASPSLARGRALVGVQIAISVPLQLAFVHFASQLPGLALPADTLADRLAFLVRWELVGAAVLLLMIGFIAGARPIWAATIGGSPSAPQLDRHVRVQRNTLEQLVVMVFAHAGLAVLLPVEELRLIPALVGLFAIARLVYWVGYARNELHRTLGFVATFYPNIYALGLALWLAFGPG